MPANQFPAAGLVVDFCQQSYSLDARPGLEIASKFSRSQLLANIFLPAKFLPGFAPAAQK
ncbi:hypothetical protein CMV61_18435 [Escherichia coli]|nr:hypothetical protein CMV61_18435 [Escherichia coli]RJK65404.1 hypothetical protein CMV59_22730 [Escherichia coli]